MHKARNRQRNKRQGNAEMRSSECGVRSLHSSAEHSSAMVFAPLVVISKYGGALPRRRYAGKILKEAPQSSPRNTPNTRTSKEPGRARHSVRAVRGQLKCAGWQAAAGRGLARPTFAPWPLCVFALKNPAGIVRGMTKCGVRIA